MSKSLYDSLKYYEIGKNNLSRNKNNLEKVINKYSKNIPNIDCQSIKYCQKFLEIDGRLRRGKKIQFYKLENYLSKEEIPKFNNFLDITGLSYLHDNLEGPVAPIRGGVVYNTKKNIYVFPKLVGRIIYPFAFAPITALLGGMIGALVHPDREITEGVVTAMKIGSLAGGFLGIGIGVHLFFESTKNPFKNLASKIKERTLYINDQIKIYNKK